jgi:hypothetical protein
MTTASKTLTYDESPRGVSTGKNSFVPDVGLTVFASTQYDEARSNKTNGQDKCKVY